MKGLLVFFLTISAISIYADDNTQSIDTDQLSHYERDQSIYENGTSQIKEVQNEEAFNQWEQEMNDTSYQGE
jgi:hypothetical protein